MKTKSTLLLPVIFAFTVIILFNSCKSATYYELTPEDLAWIVYNDGDVIKFQNPAGGTLNYSCFHKTRSYTVSGDNYYEESGISMKLLYDTTNLSGLLYIVKKEEGNTITIEWPHFYGTLYLSNTIPVVDTIGGTVYSDIYIGHSNNPSAVNTIKTIYYSKSVGMVQFTEVDSTNWVLTN